jgi:hypothetical protein
MSKNANKLKYEPCSICEEYVDGQTCDKHNCPVMRMKNENKSLLKEIERLQLEMSYMLHPNRIGDRHDMGCW